MTVGDGSLRGQSLGGGELGYLGERKNVFGVF